MLLWLSRVLIAFLDWLSRRWDGGCAGLRTGQGGGTGAGSYEVTPGGSGWVGRGRPADRWKASIWCGSRIVGQAAPGEMALAAQVGAGLAGGIALEAADDLCVGQAFGGAPGEVGACGRGGAHRGDDDRRWGVVGVPVAAAVEPV